MKSLGKLAIVLAMAVFIVGGLWAGGGRAQDSNLVTLRFCWWGGNVRIDAMNQVLDLYEAQHPNRRISREFAAWEDYWTRFNTQAAAGTDPDVSLHVMHSVQTYVNNGVLIPLEPYTESGRINISNWSPVAVGPGIISNTLYGITYALTAQVTYFNKTLINSAGLEVLPKDFTLDQYRDFILELNRRLPAGVYAAENNSWNSHTVESYMRSLGKSYYNREGTGLGFTRQDIINWFTWWENLRVAGAVPSAELTAELNLVPYTQTLFAQGRSAMWIGQANQLAPFINVMPGQEVVAGRVPRASMDMPGDFFQPTMFSISSRSNLADPAADFINWMVNDVEANVIFMVDNYGIPASPAPFRALMERATPADRVNYEICDYILNDTRVPPTAARPENSVTVMETYMREAYEDIATGVVSMEAGVDRFFREATDLLSRNTPNR